MNVKKLISPTKQKIYYFIILVMGLYLIPGCIKFVSTIYIARTYGAAQYGEYLAFKHTVPFILATVIVYIAWTYLVASLLVHINKVMNGIDDMNGRE
jgi:hypothetical protein|nr:hypothetical protein [uncultured Methanomethylovorans sp.]